jgi:FRG domain
VTTAKIASAGFIKPQDWSALPKPASLPISLRNLTSRVEHGRQVLSVPDPNLLIQTVGWLKFRATGGEVLYRGQNKLYEHAVASGFRAGGPVALEHVGRDLRNYIDTLAGRHCACSSGPYNWGQSHSCTEQILRGSPSSIALVRGTYRSAVEPLLQHYGLRTRWLDVVDNIWVALWFACHHQVTKGEFAHHRRRSPDLEGPDAKAYITVIDTGPLIGTGTPGYSIGKSTRLVDLRYAVPSVYLRPHAQHGLLIAPAKLEHGFNNLDSRVTAELEISLRDALDWLGAGVMTSTFVLFPPATQDEGYRRLMKAVSPPFTLGDILIYGPGT